MSIFNMTAISYGHAMVLSRYTDVSDQSLLCGRTSAAIRLCY